MSKSVPVPPCKFDHNGECLICDAWPSNCAWLRYEKGDFSQESEEELKKMFAPIMNNERRLIIWFRRLGHKHDNLNT